MQASPRKIIHLDMDCFYAAVEMRERPELAGQPIAVGGGSRRGVVTTCNYEARKFGVHSAMPGFQARTRCPNLVFLPVRFDLYRAESAKIREILRSYTPLVEPAFARRSLSRCYSPRSVRLGHRQGNPKAHLRRDAPDRFRGDRTEQDAGEDRERLAQTERSVCHHAGADRCVHRRPAGPQDLGRRSQECGEVRAARHSHLRATCKSSICPELVRRHGKWGRELYRLMPGAG